MVRAIYRHHKCTAHSASDLMNLTSRAGNTLISWKLDRDELTTGKLDDVVHVSTIHPLVLGVSVSGEIHELSHVPRDIVIEVVEFKPPGGLLS